MTTRRTSEQASLPARESPGWASLVQDFLVDGLGMILPGLGFLFACIPAIVIPVAWFTSAFEVFLSEKLPHKSSVSLGEFFSEYFGEYHLEVFLVIVDLSCMVGHMLFRQDIKLPDKKSFIKAHTAHMPLWKNAIGQSFAWLVWKCVFQLSGGISSRPS